MAVYRNLADHYRKRIVSGELAQGYRLPIESELADRHGVSIATISRFVKILKSEGLVYTTHVGTFVGERPADPRAGSGGPTLIRCGNTPRCNNTLELRTKINLLQFLSRVGWIRRGSRLGSLYFCHVCAPVVVEHEQSLKEDS